jgi:hypothetical protein
MEATKELMEKLMNFDSSARLDDFVKEFGANLGDHLWRRFVGQGHNVLYVYRKADTDTRKKLINLINTI